MRRILLHVILFMSFAAYAQESAIPTLTSTIYDPAAVKGYFCFGVSNNLIILDNKGSIVYYRPVKEIFDFRVIPDNKMLVTIKNRSYIMDTTFKVLDSLTCKNGCQNDAHDRSVLPDGHRILLCDERIKIDLKKHPEWKARCLRDTNGIAASVIQEQDADKNIVFEWHAKDHFSLAEMDTFYDANTPIPQLTHSNALELDYDGNILLSSRNFNEITKINHKDGSIIWRLGGKSNQFKFVNCPVPFYGQHNIKLLPNGHYTLFDDGQHNVSHGARALEFELDQVNKIFTLVWSYTYDEDMSCNGRGGVQRLPDGNTLVCYGNPTWSELMFVVVNAKRTKIMQVEGSIGVYRVSNITKLPFKLKRPVITCYDSAGVKYLEASAGYKSYKWSTGDSTRTIAVKEADSYSVYVPHEHGGFVGSEKFTITDILRPCTPRVPVNKNSKDGKTGK